LYSIGKENHGDTRPIRLYATPGTCISQGFFQVFKLKELSSKPKRCIVELSRRARAGPPEFDVLGGLCSHQIVEVHPEVESRATRKFSEFER